MALSFTPTYESRRGGGTVVLDMAAKRIRGWTQNSTGGWYAVVHYGPNHENGFEILGCFTEEPNALGRVMQYWTHD